MNHPFYFGSQQNRLLGVYHAAVEPAPLWGVVLCNPIGHEYIRSHAALRRCAERLSAAGFPTLRFDYACTGDSAGESHNASVTEWVENIATATDELVDMSEVRSVALVGLRFGATLACIAASHTEHVSAVIMWDPVIRGSSYLEELRRLQKTDLEPSAQNDAEFEELIGFELSKKLRRELGGIDLCQNPPDSIPAAVGCVFSEESEEYACIPAHFQEKKQFEQRTTLRQPPEWRNPKLIGHVLLAGQETGHIVEIMEKFSQ